MAGLVPFNRKKNALSSTGFEEFYNVLDDFFNDNWLSGRNLMRDTFKIDVKETDKEYLVEAELPGTRKEEIDLKLNEGYLTISIRKEENVNEENQNYIHRERRLSSMSRSLHLADASSSDIKAKLDNGVLTITVAKQEKVDNTFKIEIE